MAILAAKPKRNSFHFSHHLALLTLNFAHARLLPFSGRPDSPTRWASRTQIDARYDTI